MKEKIIMVLDTETLGLDNPTIYELGYVIHNQVSKEILKERDYLIKQVYDNKELFASAYYSHKRPLYEEKLATGLAKNVWWGYALKVLVSDIQKYGVDEIYAFNSKFDTRAIKHTMEQLRAITKFETEILDIMNYIKSITDTESYMNFCESNGYMTKHKKPKPQKKAETLYRYLTNNVDFIEDHMALEDSQIELYILKVALGLI